MSIQVAEAQTSDSLQERFERDGYLVVSDMLSAGEVEEIRQEAAAICRGDLGRIKGADPLPPGLSDDEVIANYLCIHHPHKLSSRMLGYMSHPGVVDVLTTLIGPNVKSMQSMLFIKAAGKPGQAWHQDEAFIPTRDKSLVGAWIALDDATTENGCLWVVPGSHKHGILWDMEETDDDRYDCSQVSINFPYTDDDAVAVEMPAGSVIFFNGYLLHRSLPNVAQTGFRRSLVNHYMSAESLLPWSYDLDLATRDYRDIVMVAGTDPYAFKGLEQRVSAQIRPERQGGCEWIGEDHPENEAA